MDFLRIVGAILFVVVLCWMFWPRPTEPLYTEIKPEKAVTQEDIDTLTSRIACLEKGGKYVGVERQIKKRDDGLMVVVQGGMICTKNGTEYYWQNGEWSRTDTKTL